MYKIFLDAQKADSKQKQPFEKIKLVVLKLYSKIQNIRNMHYFNQTYQDLL